MCEVCLNDKRWGELSLELDIIAATLVKMNQDGKDKSDPLYQSMMQKFDRCILLMGNIIENNHR